MTGEPPGGVHNEVAGHAAGVVQAGHIHGDVHVHQHHVLPRAAGGPVVVGRIPRRSAAFQPRSALAGRLAADGLSVLVGPRGIGKTQLAAAYTRMRVADRRRAVVWIDAQDHDRVALGWQRLAERLCLRAAGETITSGAEAARAWVEDLTEPSLIVFDNAVDPEIVDRWLPRHGRAQVLVTTTSHAFEDFGTAVEVGLFDEGESLAYLRERTQLPDDGAHRLIEELDRLPLALALAAGLIRRQRIGYDLCVRRLRTFPLDRYLPARPGDPYPRGVAQAVLLSVGAAEEADETGLTEILLAALAVLSPGGTARRLLHEIAGNLVLPEEPAAATDAVLGRLAEESIVTLSTDGGLAFMHRVTGRVLRDRLQQAASRQTVVEVVVRALEDLTQHSLGPRLPERAWAEHLVEQIHAVHRLPLDDAHASRLLGLRHWIAKYHLAAGEYDRAVAAYAEVMPEYQERSGNDPDHRRPPRSEFAQALARAHRFEEAIALQEEVLAAACAEHGHLDTIIVALQRVTLAFIHQLAGNFEEALRLELQTWHHRKAFLGADDPRTLMAQLRLGTAFRRAGDAAAALELLESAESACARVHPESFLMLDIKKSVAVEYAAAGRTTDAIARNEAILADWNLSWGGTGEEPYLSVVCDLAGNLTTIGRYDEAIALCETTVSGVDEETRIRVDSLNLHSILAELYHRTGRTGEAIGIRSQMVRDAERMYGPDHVITRDCRRQLTELTHERSRD
ncbi:tetratricopeptide repeat protein [Amycolatopsis sp. NPDC049688]|uniref:tetratricopeptide repeat protein n=1 Tax=Amycolatopsis sp. NPDC049688 TaxID=3154733 RepID=UPI00341ACAC0